jgi:hypothetical protein
LRCATPPVIHHVAASAAILLSQNNLLSQNKNYTEILQTTLLPYFDIVRIFVLLFFWGWKTSYINKVKGYLLFFLVATKVFC